MRGLTKAQIRLVRLFVSGDRRLKSELYKEAYQRKEPHGHPRVRAGAHRAFSSPKVKEAIDALLERENTEALLSREEKRLFLASIVRAHMPANRARDPDNPLLNHDPVQALKADNDMSGDHKAVKIEGELTIAGILAALPSTRAIPSIKPVDALPIESAGGGYGLLPGMQASLPEGGSKRAQALALFGDVPQDDPGMVAREGEHVMPGGPLDQALERVKTVGVPGLRVLSRKKPEQAEQEQAEEQEEIDEPEYDEDVGANLFSSGVEVHA